jgi:hypothetical protein
MPMRLLLMLLVLSVETGCPHAFGKGGTIDMAVRKDMREYYSQKACDLSKDQWLEICDDRNGKTIQPSCPRECRPH